MAVNDRANDFLRNREQSETFYNIIKVTYELFLRKLSYVYLSFVMCGVNSLRASSQCIWEIS